MTHAIWEKQVLQDLSEAKHRFIVSLLASFQDEARAVSSRAAARESLQPPSHPARRLKRQRAAATQYNLAIRTAPSPRRRLALPRRRRTSTW